MKLISCYIENFGGISRQTFTFRDGFNGFLQENGSGKTTLSVFLSAMFYGLPAAKTNSGFNDRLHFYPFNGGKFGGNLTFSHEGKTWRVERFFDRKTEDELKVTVNGEETEIPGKNLGLYVMGISEDTFRRLLFWDGTTTISGSNAELNQKLGGSGTWNADPVSVEKAGEKLEEAAKRIQANRKKDTLLLKAKEQEAALGMELAAKRHLAALLPELEQQKEKIRKATEEAVRRKNAAVSGKILSEKYRTRQLLEEDHQRTERKIQEISLRYPKGIPSEEEIRQLNAMGIERLKAKSLCEKSSFDEKEAARLTELCGTFSDGVPGERTLDEISEKITELSGTSEVLRHLKQDPFTAEESEVFRTFTGREAEAEEAGDRMRQALEELRQKKAAAEQSGRPKKAFPWELLLWLLGGFGIAGGILLWLLGKQTVPGAALCAGGAILLIVGTVLHGVGRKRELADRLAREELLEEIRNSERLVRERAKEFLSPELREEADRETPEILLRDFEQRFSSFGKLKERKAAREAELLEKQNRETELNNEISLFFGDFGLSGKTPMSMLGTLRNLISEKKNLEKERDEDVNARNEAMKTVSRLSLECEKLLEPYGLENPEKPGELASRLTADRENLKKMEELFAQQAEGIRIYTEENGLTGEIPPEPVQTPEEIDLEIAELARKRSVLDANLAEAEEAGEEARDCARQLAETTERIRYLTKRHEVLTKAAKFLRESDKALREQYLAPLENRFAYYSSLLEKSFDFRVELTEDLSLRIESNGQYYPENHLSAGQRACVELCIRMSIADSVFGEAAPFFLMDDPFSALDEASCGKALDVLRSIGEKTQIVYLTCHPSRAPE